jgi:toxin ParE1/3/4
MSRGVIKRPQVTRDLAEQAVFIGRNNPEAANRFLHAAEDAFGQLDRLPQMGSPRQFRNPALAGLRLWRIPGFERYLIFYRPIPEGIEVIRVLHAARDIAGILEHEE